jgi:hypothetical protein
VFVQVNMQVEPLVREALGAAVNRDPDKSGEARRTVLAAGDETLRDSTNLALTICALALFDIYDGAKPSDEQLGDLATTFVAAEAWAQFDEQTVLRFLNALAEGTPADQVVDPEVLVRLAFVVGGWLLAGFLTEGERWNDFLDQILDTIEAQPRN